MKNALALPKIAGISVYVHWTFAILIGWIVLTNLWRGLDWLHVSWMVLFVLGLFVCVTLHELGHALAARRYGIRTQDITLYPIGGVARLERMPSKPTHELVVALAGPAVNIIIMLVLWPLIANLEIPQEDGVEVFLIDQDNFLPMLGIVNVWLAVFNLIPAFPMDGGRVLRALLSMRMDRVRATEIAAFIGQAIAILFVFAGFYGNPFLIFIGLFVILGARAEADAVRSQSFLEGYTAGDALMTNFQTLDKHQTIRDAVHLLLAGQARTFLITENGFPYGVLTRDHIIRGIQSAGENAPVHLIADTQLHYFDIHTPLEEVLTYFQETPGSIVLVRDGNGLVGIIDSENISELIMINAARLRTK
ncbi:MAG: site-2 protease family protein [Saprospiraceae bacterium]|nr:site-2 protease family protein [Saprospiraceae bacterium]MDW8484432.1 site-2 protease family protein [Saprospiraceae bacterium]